MKTKIFIAASLILVSILVLGFKNKDNSTRKMHDAFIIPVNQAVMYIGINNPVFIYVKGVDSKNLIIDIQGGTITPNTGEGISNFTHFVKPDPKSKAVNISISDKSKKDKVLYTKSFVVKRIPDPICTFAGRTEGAVYKNELLKNPHLQAKIENFIYDDLFVVKSFNILIKNAIGMHEFETKSGEIDSEYVYTDELFDFYANGNKLSPDMIKEVENAQIGSIIYIENIVAASVIDGHTRVLAPIRILLL